MGVCPAPDSQVHMHVRMRMSTRQLNRACDYLGMKLGTYEAIVSIIEKEIHEKDCMKKLAKEFPRLIPPLYLSMLILIYIIL